MFARNNDEETAGGTHPSPSSQTFFPFGVSSYFDKSLYFSQDYFPSTNRPSFIPITLLYCYEGSLKKKNNIRKSLFSHRVGGTNEKRATSIRCSLSRNYLLGEKRNRDGGRSLPKRGEEGKKRVLFSSFLFIFSLFASGLKPTMEKAISRTCSCRKQMLRVEFGFTLRFLILLMVGSPTSLSTARLTMIHDKLHV